MSRVARTLNVDAMRELARRRLPRFVFDYVEGGAEDEISLRRNIAAWSEVEWRPRTLVDVSQRSTEKPLLGVQCRMPVAVGPTGLAGLSCAQGDRVLAEASAAQGVPFVLTTASSVSIEDIRRAAPEARLWFQAYVFKERGVTEALIRRAADAGYEALVLTSDVPLPAKRERDWRNGFTQPIALTWSAKLDVLLHPRWMWSVMFNQPRFVLVEQELEGKLGKDVLFPTLIDPSITWDDLARVRAAWPRKLLLKGVLTPGDAERAVGLGCDGVVVSNHGGRQLDGAPAAIDVLPEIAKQLRGRASVLCDGGIRRGSDIAKAIALGADGVLLGRAPLYGLGAGGRVGVERVLSILHEELDRALGLVGCPRLADLDETYVHRSPSTQA